MLVAGGLLLIGSLGASTASQVVLLGLFRVASGLGIGAASAVVPYYVTEISPTNIRGRLGTFWQFAIVLGQLLGLLAGYGIANIAGGEAAAMPWGGAAWRWMYIVVAVSAVIYLIIAFRLPQSPPDLVRLGQEEKAKSLLARISDRPAGEAFDSIRANLEKQEIKRRPWPICVARSLALSTLYGWGLDWQRSSSWSVSTSLKRTPTPFGKRWACQPQPRSP